MLENNIKKKKIMFLMTASDVGGAEVIVRNIIFNLDKNRYDPIFVSIKPIGLLGQEISEQIRVESLNQKYKFNPLVIYRLYKMLKKEKPDILNSHLIHANLLARVVGHWTKVPKNISSVHNENFGNKLRYLLFRLTDRLADLNLVVSQRIKDQLVKEKISLADKIKVIYNGTKLARQVSQEELITKKEDLGLGQNQPILLFLSRLTKVKGCIYLIRALDKLKDKYPQIKLLIVGDGPEKNNLETEVKKLDLSNNVLFLGQIRDVDLYYQLADLFVLPSFHEGLPGVVIESFANKTLTLATKSGPIPEIINQEINGFIVDKLGDSEALFLEIEKALSMKEEKKQSIIENAYADYLAKFTIPKMVKEYENVYESLLEE